MAEYYARHSERIADLNAGCAGPDGSLWAIAAHGSPLNSADGGITWRPNSTTPLDIRACAAWGNDLIAPAPGGIVYRLDGSSHEWKPSQSPRVEALSHVVVRADKEIFVGGANGVVLQSNNGSRWKDISPNTHDQILGMASCDDSVWIETSDELWVRNQSQWSTIHSPFASLKAVACSESSHAVAITNEKGDIAVSFDGGEWRTVDTGVDMTFTVLDLTDDREWIAAGGNGAIIYSTDRGAHWQSFTTFPININLNAEIHTQSSLTFLGSEGLVLSGKDMLTLRAVVGAPLNLTHFLPGHEDVTYGAGGLIQVKKPTAHFINVGTLHDINAITIGSSGNYWAVTNYGHLFTSSDLEHWRQLYVSKEEKRVDYFSVVTAANDRTVIVASGGGRLLTFANGSSPKIWQSKAQKDFHSIAVSGNRVVAVGSSGTRAISFNAGEDWEEISDDTDSSLNSIIFAGNLLFAVGNNGMAIQSADGLHWTQIDQVTNTENGNLRSITCLASCNNLLAVGDQGAVWRSDNNGKEWSSLKEPLKNFAQASWSNGQLWIMLGTGELRAFKSLDAPLAAGLTSVNYAVYCDGANVWISTDKGTLMHSADSGETWQPLATPALGKLYFISGRKGTLEMWAVGTRGSIISSTSNPTQWKDEHWDTSVDLVAVSPVKDGVLIVGFEGTILRKAAGGSWARMTTPVDTALRGIATDGPGRNVWVVGDSGVVLHSADAGKTWTKQSADKNYDLYAVARLSTPFGPALVAIGTGGTELLSQDDGVHWYERSFPNGKGQAIVAVSSNQQFWATTDSGALLTSNDFGASWISTDLNVDNSSIFGIDALVDGSRLYVAGDNGVFERLDRLRSEYVIQSVDLTTNAQDIDINIILAGYEGSPPSATLRMMHESERPLGIYENLPVSISQLISAGRLELDLKTPMYDRTFLPGEKVWFSPCLQWPNGTTRCLPMRAAVVTPLIDFKAHWKGFTAFFLLLLLVTVESILLWLAPQMLLRLHHAIKAFEDTIKDKVPFGNVLININHVLLVPWFAFSSRSLDSWIRINGPTLSQETRDISWYVPLPIVIESQGNRDLGSRPVVSDFIPAISARHISILGPGGAGKTSLSRQIGSWLSQSNELTRALACKAAVIFLRDRVADTLESISMEVAERLGTSVDQELLRALLTKGRLIVILDAVSERPERALIYLEDLKSKLVARLVITTARTLDSPSSSMTILRPQPLEADSLLFFMVLLLERQDLNVTDAKVNMKLQLQIAQKLEAVVGSVSGSTTITPLLVEAFVAKAVTLLRAGATLDGLPKTVPEAYLSYVKEMVLRGPKDITPTILLHIAKRIATLCLEKNFIPVGIDEVATARTLQLDEKVATYGIGILISAGLLVRGGGVLDTEVRFALDPVAEYCAAVRWHESDSATEWEKRKSDAQGFLPQSQGIVRAMLAVEQMH